MWQDWTRSVTLRALGIGFLGLLLMIPLFQVQGLVRERQGLEFEARAKIAERWGEEQSVGGPVLVVPMRKSVQNDKGVVTTYDVARFLLPERLRVEGTLETERRHYGIYETPVYTAVLRFSGHFEPAAIAAMNNAGGDPQWHAASLRVPVTDVRGIRQVSVLRIDGRELAFGPGGQVAGISTTEVDWPLDDAVAQRPLPFSFEMRLAGTAVLRFLPLARQTDVHLASAWPDPSFTGAFLPASHDTGTQGFSAQWQVLDLNRAFGQSWSEGANGAPLVLQSGFGVELYQPVDAYQRNERAGKYGVLFIALTFAALFLFDVLGRWRVHPVQYLLVGVALCTFYVVLLALSEQVGFGMAYLLAALAVVAIVGGYARAAARGGAAATTLGGLLAFVYALLYGLVISEQYSLLMGALALLAAVAILMYLTRRVDWYALGPARIDVPAGMDAR
ncbi:cell envelope integrity protein CreD [Dokdonella sp.]|uniref:cell envelope integrity protein CreD n=1 Tax=Dokdonella sp. TaxID=2291710 RepID=UPI0025B90166|nr:cell envelope integrity protein CreD [Dokdonella sp.]MBX3692149.1 cell envelope integrity protein CreD [Dokdonella sp.]MCW5567313.1 cell envelope integrity protein CreD [Dokdonella sp.]